MSEKKKEGKKEEKRFINKERGIYFFHMIIFFILFSLLKFSCQKIGNIIQYAFELLFFFSLFLCLYYLDRCNFNIEYSIVYFKIYLLFDVVY